MKKCKNKWHPFLKYVCRIFSLIYRWSQPEIALWWDGIQLDDREEWNEDWAIVDGAGYFDIQELENGNLAFVESNKLTVRYHEISVDVLNAMKKQLYSTKKVMINQKVGILKTEDPVFTWKRDNHKGCSPYRAPGTFYLFTSFSNNLLPRILALFLL